jgi:hypothetical protein
MCKTNNNKKDFRLQNSEYIKYLEYYGFEDSEDNFNCFVIWKGFGMRTENINEQINK